MNLLSMNKIKELITEAYKLKPTKIKLLELGTINLSYLVETRNRKFVFRIYQRNITKRQIEIEHKLITFLKEKKFPVANIIKTIKGKTLGYKNGIFFTLFDFIAGKHLYKTNIKQLKSAAKLLGHYHFIVREYNYPQKKDWWYVESIALEKYLKQAENLGAPHQFLLFLGRLIKLFRVNANINDLKRLPHIFIHGDFSLRNLKFIGNKISGVFDFDNIRKELRIFDFVRPLQSIVGMGKDVNKNRIKIFFNEYLRNSQIPLLSSERKYLIEMFRIQHLKEALWQLRQYLISKKTIHFECLKKEIKFLKWLDTNYCDLIQIFKSL